MENFFSNVHKLVYPLMTKQTWLQALWSYDFNHWEACSIEDSCSPVHGRQYSWRVCWLMQPLQGMKDPQKQYPCKWARHFLQSRRILLPASWQAHLHMIRSWKFLTALSSPDASHGGSHHWLPFSRLQVMETLLPKTFYWLKHLKPVFSVKIVRKSRKKNCSYGSLQRYEHHVDAAFNWVLVVFHFSLLEFESEIRLGWQGVSLTPRIPLSPKKGSNIRKTTTWAMTSDTPAIVIRRPCKSASLRRS